MSREKELYEEAYKKQMRYSRRVLFTVFLTIGLIFAIMGTVLLICGVQDEDGTFVGAVFLPMGIVWIVLAFIFRFAISDKGNYEKYKKQVEKYGYRNYYDMFATIEILTAKNEELERRVRELEEKIK